MTMRNTIKDIVLFFIVALMASCAQEPLESPLYSGEITISAFQGDRQNETKTALVDGEVYWSASEHISIFYGSGENGGSEFISTNTEPAPQVEFSGYINAVTGTVEGNQPLMFWGIYPYNALNSCDGNGITTVIPDHQTAKPDTFADNQFVSVGRAPGLAMGFYNLLSGLKITFSKRTDITEIRVRSLNAQDKLAGKVHVVLDEENHPVVDNVIDGKAEIVLTCPEGETFQKGHYYYALFRPQTLSQGIVIDFYAGSDYIGSREYAKSLNFYRNMFKRGDDIDSDIVLAVTGVELNKTSLSLAVGAEETLQATVTPADAADKTVTWSSSDETVATVSSNGKVTAVKAGQAEITASAGGKSATCTVTVSNVAVTSVSLNKTTLTLTKGGSETLTATVLPNNATDKTVTWTTSNSAVASVDANGKVTAVGGGTAKITATSGTKSAECTVTVNVPVTGVSLNKTTTTIYIGSTETLVPTVTPDDATNKNVTWSSGNTTVATVSSSGVVTAKQAGTAIITVKTADGNKTATCTVTISPVSVTSVTLDKSTLSFSMLNTTQKLTATVKPDNATDKTVTWSSDNTSVATVSSNGTVTSKGSGTAKITASVGGKSAECTVTVNVPVTGVTLNKTSTSITVGGTETLTATVAPSTASNKNVTWSSSDGSVATVSSSGKVTAVSVGTATITVKTVDGNKTATCAVTVTPKAVTSVTLNKTSLSLNKGSYETLTATVKPDDATDKTVTWSSSNSSIASVDASGKVTGVAAGSATITAQAGTKTATCTVTVAVPVTSIKIYSRESGAEVSSLSMYPFDTDDLSVVCYPTDATNKSLYENSSNQSWSLSMTGYVLCTFGLVSALEEGIGKSTVVTVRVNGLSASCTISVLNPSPSPVNLGLSVNWADRNLYTQTSSGTGRFYTWAKASNYESGRDVAMYATNGNWRLPTKAEIQELLDNCTAAQATVNGVTGVRFTASNGKSIFIPDVGGYMGNTFYPASQMGVFYWSGTADGVTSCGYRLRWMTVDHSPSIDTGGGTQYRFAVRPVSTSVNQIDVTSVSISPSYSTTVSLGGTKQLTATVSPSNATNRTVTWSSSNTSIATVSSSGLVTGVGVGTATIKAQAGTKYATCDVVVQKIPVSSVTISKTSLPLKVGSSASLSATVAPTNATYQTITWTSSNTSIATVSNDGRVTAVSRGTAYITATADGVSSSRCTVTVTDPDPALIYKQNYYYTSTTNSHDAEREYTYSSYLTGFENAMVIQMQVELVGLGSGSNAYLGSWNLAYAGEGSCIYLSKSYSGVSRLYIEDIDDNSYSFNLSNYGLDVTDLLTIEYNGIQHTITVNGNTESCNSLGKISLPYLLVLHYDNSEDAGREDDYEKTYKGIPNNSKIYYIKAYNASNSLIKSGARSNSKYANSANNNTKEYCWEWKSGSTTTREFATQGRYTSSTNAYEPYEAQ